MAQLRLSLLGGFSVTLDDQPVTGFESDKVRALLAYMAVEGDRPQRRESLAALLWPEQSGRRARHNLRQALFNLRMVISDHQNDPPFLIISPSTIQFNSSSNTWLDVTVFSRAYATCQGHKHDQLRICYPCLERLEKAASVYQGRFLDGLTLKGYQEFNEWVMVEAQRLHHQAVSALARLAIIHQGLGNPERMSTSAMEWVALEPYDEAAHRAVMIALAMNGQWEAALNQYKICRDLFVDKLGVELDTQTRQVYEQLLAGELSVGISSIRVIREGLSKPLGECPYRDLTAFQEKDAPFFFGREEFVDRVDICLRSYPPITVIVGALGSGKSSAVYAGLLPRLREDRRWLIVQMRPGRDPFLALSLALQDLRLLPASEVNSLGEALRHGDTHLVDVCKQVVEQRDGRQLLLLIVDQFEELYTLCPDLETRQCFLTELLSAVNARREGGERICSALLTLRADFMGQVLSYRPIADTLQEACLLMGPLNREELQAAIEKPAEVQGVGFEHGLVARLLDDVGEEPGNLPLLEFALTLLWERETNGCLSHATYEQIGRVRGALGSYADEVYENLTLEEQERARWILLQLVQPGEGTEDTRRVAGRDELGEANWNLVQHLADRRLVVTGRDQAGNECAEVAHEALIQSWGQFQQWMNVDRAFRVWQERLRGSMRQWQQSDHNEGALLRGAPLVEAEGWLHEGGHGLSEAEESYIRYSVELQRRLQTRRDRQRKWIVSALATGLIITLLLVLFIWQQRQEARRQASIGLASQAISEMGGTYPERAVLLALEALENYPYTWQAERALGKAVLDGRLRLILTHDDYVNSAEWSADGSKILTGSSDGTVRLWDATSGAELLKIADEEPSLASWSLDGKAILTVNPKEISLQVWDIEKEVERFTLSKDDIGGELSLNLEQWAPWSPSGDRFLTYSMDGRVKIWDARTGQLLNMLLVYPDQAGQAPVSPEDMDQLVHYFYVEDADQALWSPSGDMIAVSSSVHNRVAILRVDSGEIIYTIPGDFEDKGVFVGSWSPSGDRFVTRGLGGVKVYDSASGTLLLNLSTPESFIYRAIWSPDGSRLLTSGIDDGTARIWDVESGKEVLQISNMVAASASDWSTSRGIMAVGGNDGIIRVWDTDKGREIRYLFGTQPRITTVEFSPTGDRLLAIGDENVVHVYDLSEAILSIGFDSGPIGIISNVAWSPDSQQIAIGTRDNTAKVWNATSGEQRLVFEGHYGIIWVISWFPSGDRFITASADHTLVVWDADTGEQQLIFDGHQDEVFGLALSPDGSQIASSDISSGKVILWDPHTGEEILTFSGHQDFVSWVYWSPDGQRLLSIGSHGEAFIWDATTGEVYHDLFPDDLQLDIVAAAWARDGKRVFIQSVDGVFHVFDPSNGRELSQFEMPRASLSLFSLSPNEERILKGGYGSAKVRDLKNGAELLSYDIPGWVDARYSPDGTKILIGSNQGILEIYPTWHSTQELIDYARECCLVRELTPEERNLFGLPPLRE